MDKLHTERRIDRRALDSQKLKYHTELLARWLTGEAVWPIYFEIGPAGGCNNRCIFCAYEYLDHRAGFISAEPLMSAISTLAAHGAKSCMFAGEGDPFLHPKIADFVAHSADSGLDVAITTNLLAADEAMMERILPSVAWVRCSLNATNQNQYEIVHNGPKNGFQTVWENLTKAIEIRDNHHLRANIGVQCIVLAENVHELVEFAQELTQIGVDYLALKPCIAHPKMAWQPTPIGQDPWGETIARVKTARIGDMAVIARQMSRQKSIEQDRGYKHCLALPFFAEIISDGRVFSCGPMLGNEKFCYGNINNQSFEDIWQSEQRKKICRYAAEEMDLAQCMRSCRLDQINEFLWELKNPPEHVNFI